MNLAVLAALTLVAPATAGEHPKVTAVRVPGDSRQPRAAIDSVGVLHLVVFRGALERGDLHYARSTDGGANFGAALRITTDETQTSAGSPSAAAQIALGRGGRAHVAWNGLPGADDKPAAMLYARLDDAGKSFEAPRNMISKHHGIVGGGAVATDGAGGVWVAWHAPLTPGSDEGERAIFVVQSGDEGQRFGAERPISLTGSGVGACCNFVVLPDPNWSLGVIYRTARKTTTRDTMFTWAGPTGRGYRILDDWESAACVPTSYCAAASPSGALVALESDGAVRWYRPFNKPEPMPTFTPPGDSSPRKYPALAVNAKGEVLLAWIAKPTATSGGTLEWCVSTADGVLLENSAGKREDVPAFDLPSAIALPSGDFVLFY
jgi:hypothetical protein